MSRRRPRVCSRLTAPRAKSRCVHDRTLRVEQLEQRHLLSVSSLFPEANSHDAAVSTDIQLDFTQAVDAATVNDQTVVVHAGQTGRLLSSEGDIASLAATGAQVTLDPSGDFHAGELVEVTITDGLQENGGGTSAGGPYVWQFRTATKSGPGVFNETDLLPASSSSYNNSEFVTLGDVDGDGDLDAVGEHVYLNQGGAQGGTPGQFLINSNQQVFVGSSKQAAALGDLDGDGDLDALFASSGSNYLYLNQGGAQGGTAGSFSYNGQLPGNGSFDIELGDLDGDGDLDAFAANNVWLNEGGAQGGTEGQFVNSGQQLSIFYSHGVSLGDLDGDGDLDAFSANNGVPNQVLLNNGDGLFADSGQTLGNQLSVDVELGDLDGDGDLDAFITNGYFSDGPNEVWLNDGTGVFSDTGQLLGNSDSRGLTLGDFDGDGDLDAFVANIGDPNELWLNDGAGTFSAGGQLLGDQILSYDVELGDLDGDGDLDAFVAGSPNKVWINGLPVDASVSSSESQVTVTDGAALSYTFVVSGDATTDLVGIGVSGTFSNELTNVSWTTSTSGGATAPASGNGDFEVLVDLPAGSTVTFFVTGNVALLGEANWNAEPIVSSSVHLALPAEYFDTDLGNNGANDSNLVELPAVGGSGQFDDSGQQLGGAYSRDVALGDVDGDGDLDAWVANGWYEQPDRVWINQGGAQGGTPGVFADSGQALGNEDSTAVALGDIDNDGDLDAVVSTVGPKMVWLNQGGAQGGTPGVYVDSGQRFGGGSSNAVWLVELNGDGYLDAVIHNYTFNQNQFWYNQGGVPGGTPGVFAGDIISDIPNYPGGRFGDLDGDGDVDFLYRAVLLNQGGAQGGTLGEFVASQGLGGDGEVAIGDLDGDGDLDAFVGFAGSKYSGVWINQGGAQGGTPGEFIDSGQELVPESQYYSRLGYDVELGDFDGDGDLDALVMSGSLFDGIPVGNGLLWVNQGGTQGGTEGEFSFGGLTLGSGISKIAIGDLDGDGDLDFFAANAKFQPNTVWLNHAGVDLSITLDSSSEVTVTQGDSLSYTIVVTGDADVDLTDIGVSGDFASLLTNVGWTTSTTGGATAPASGSGDIDVLVDLPAGSTVTFNVTADVPAPGSANLPVESTVTNSVQLILAPELLDFDLSDNAVTDTDTVVLAATGGTGLFIDGGQNFNPGQALGVPYHGRGVLGDVDGDGDLDAFGTAGGSGRVWINQGGAQAGTAGQFSDSGQDLGALGSAIALGDVDGDGDLDAVADQVFLNQGGAQGGIAGQFVASHLITGFCSALALTDLDGDGDLDIFLVSTSARTYLNQGGVQGGVPGEFLWSGMSIGTNGESDVSLGDVDGDGDLDAFVANLSSNLLLLNQGGAQGGIAGVFSDSGQTLGGFGRSVSLGDVDGDGDLDAYIANDGPNRVWINQGGIQGGTSGQFIDSGQALGIRDSEIVSLGDVDGDGDLDAFVANNDWANEVWLNQGGAQGGTEGMFANSGQAMGTRYYDDLSLGDVDGDGDLDALIGGGYGLRVWFNANPDQQLLDGDYNGNGTIDAADYTAWRDAKTYGATTLLNDHTPGTVNEDDYLYWRAHFGETVGSGSGAVAAVSEAAAGAESEPAAVDESATTVAEETSPSVAALATTVRATSVLSPAVQAAGFAALANDLSAPRVAHRARLILAHRLRVHAAVGESELLLLATAKAVKESASGHQRFRLAEADDKLDPCDREIPADPLAVVVIDWE